MRHGKFALSAVSFLAVSSLAYANAGTPLTLEGMFHLVVGSAVIGLLEGLAIALVFNRPKLKAIALLVFANHVSAWVGGMFLREALVSAVPMDLNDLRPTFWTMVSMTYIITLVLEFPFVVLVFRHDTRWLRNSMLGTLAVQTASYVFLFWCYWQASGVSLLTETAAVEPEAISLRENVVVYFTSTEDGDVCELRLAEMVKVGRIYGLNSQGLDDRVMLRNSARDEVD